MGIDPCNTRAVGAAAHRTEPTAHPWACTGCGAGSQHRAGTSSFKCRVCAGTTEFRACPSCGHGLSVSPTLMAVKKAELHCSACGEDAPRKKFKSTGIERVAQPESFSAAYSALGLSFADCAGYSGRRAIHGMLVGAVGLSAGSDGGGVSLYFEKNVLVACIGSMANAGCIPIADLTEITVGGRADFAGREPADRPDSVAVSQLLASTTTTALRYREPTPTETLVTVVWDDGGIVVLNQTIPSNTALQRFQPVLDRAFKARSNTSESIVDQIALFAMFEQGGMMSKDEADAATAKALGHERPH